MTLARLPLPATAYGSLTFPMFRPLLQGAPDVVAVGASEGGEPAGLALARIEESGCASILSLAVRPGLRRRGVGRSLLRRLELELVPQCQRGQLTFMGGAIYSEAVESLLSSEGWSTHPRMLVCRSNREAIAKAPWLGRSYLSEEFSIFPWVELTAEERLAVECESRFPYPRTCSPFVDEHLLEPVSSLGLRYRGEVVGWLITHMISDDTLRFTRMFVRADLQKRARGISLLIESLGRYLNHPKVESAPNAIFDIHVENTPMLEFAKRRLLPYMTSAYLSYGATKDKLGANDVQALSAHFGNSL